MAHGGKRPGAGRKAGAKQRATAEQVATLAELARIHTETALNVLVSVAKSSESDAAKVSAANAILDRGHGKPVSHNEHSGPNGEPLIPAMSDTELARLMVFQLTKVSRDTPTTH